MRFVALATDFDGTLAHDGAVDDSTIAALERLKSAGKRLIMATGRELPELQRVFARLQLFDAVVAENGALLYLPSTDEERVLSTPPPPEFIEALRSKGVGPISVGRGIVATWEPHEGAVLEAIRELGLEWQVIFNKGAVMSVAPGVNKASGLAAALAELRVSEHNTVGIGDAENDHALIQSCGCAVAVSNALDALKSNADLVTQGDHGAGVAEMIDLWLRDEPNAFGNLAKHALYIGESEAPLSLQRDDFPLLICGHSGAGKTGLTNLLLERLIERRYQVFIVDPEGDYGTLRGAAYQGHERAPPKIDEAMGLLVEPHQCVALNLLGVEVPQRPAFGVTLWQELATLHAREGRPHWVVIDEAHHLFPAGGDIHSPEWPVGLPPAILVTTRPDAISADVLGQVRTIAGVGPDAFPLIAQFAQEPALASKDSAPPADDEIIVWKRGQTGAPVQVRVAKAREQHQRHTRKYAEGKLSEDKSFFFRGAHNALNLRAHNLATFVQLAQGVDLETWRHHLKQGDYSHWFSSAIRDDDLSAEAREIEAMDDADAARAAMAELIKRRYAAADIP